MKFPSLSCNMSDLNAHNREVKGRVLEGGHMGRVIQREGGYMERGTYKCVGGWIQNRGLCVGTTSCLKHPPRLVWREAVPPVLQGYLQMAGLLQ